MDNQQERLVSTDFVAGLITGEGTFTLGVFRKGKNVRITPLFSMQMNDGDTMRDAAAALQNAGLPCHIYHRSQRGCWTMQAGGHKRLRRYLDVFLPLLRGKKLEAALIVDEFIRSREGGTKFDPYTDEQLALVDKIRSVNGVPGRKRTAIDDLRGSQRNRQWKARPESSEAIRRARVTIP